MLYVSVYILSIPYHVDKPYTYHLPLQLETRVKRGSVVVVPFGGANRLKNAVVVGISDKTDCKNTKAVAGIPGRYMYVSEEMLGLCEYMKQNLFCSFGDAVKCVLPAGLGVKAVKVYVPVQLSQDEMSKACEKLNAPAREVLSFIVREGSASQQSIKKHYGVGAVSCISVLEKLGLCVSEDGFECHINEKSQKYAAVTEDDAVISDISEGKIRLTPKQSAVFDAILKYESPCPVSELSEVSGTGISVINELAKRNIIQLFSVENDRNADLLKAYDTQQYGEFNLTEKQNGAFEELLGLYNTHSAKAALLYGVTGSGKTNVVLKLIDRVISDGKSVIVLVPEIALTSQTVGRFAARYGQKVALIHSGLSAGERMDAWKKITEDKAKIVIGTRSAVFAPVKNLGLIVLDEEQESSFKSDKSPKYHARDIARFRCAYNDSLMLLASATPSVESYYKANSGKYSLVTLEERYNGAKLPEVIFSDMRSEPYFEMSECQGSETDGTENADMLNNGKENAGLQNNFKTPENKACMGAVPAAIGSVLKKELEENIKRGEQSILFINRRGFRSFAQCHSCGHTFECPNCSVSLTHHRNLKHGKDFLMCHYCGYTKELPDKCPVCKKADSIVYMGAGTQLIEAQLKKQFPKIRVLRMDADTTGGKMSHERILESFRNKDADVLVGTQMVAKGHDFPNVSLVGVINADTSLYLNDYRANEKTFALLTQVLGRAGRAEKSGRAVIQTYNPDNDILRLSGVQDYKAFYENEIQFRRAAIFPPFCDIITLTFSGLIENDVINAVKEFSVSLDEKAKNQYPDVKFILFGPFRNDIYRLSGKYRMRFIVKCANNSRLRAMFSELICTYTAGLKNVTVSADINPQNL